MTRLVGTRTRARAATMLLAAVSIAIGTAAPAASHGQIVQPPGHDEPVVSGPISKAWAQAHCNAASPAIVTEASNGVVAFPPGTALPCPDIPNPGGQVHP